MIFICRIRRSRASSCPATSATRRRCVRGWMRPTADRSSPWTATCRTRRRSFPELIEKWRAGYQVVFARRRSRCENVLKKAAYFSFYRLLRQVSEVPIPLDTGDFALMDRRALDEMNNMPERTRFLRGLRSWVGFRQAEVEYDREPRHTGRTKYSFRRLLRLAMDGILSFSDAPLKAVTLTGCLGVHCRRWQAWSAPSPACGRSAASTRGMVVLGTAMGMLGGVQLIGLGVLGEYMSRIYREVRGRPMYVARDRVGFQRMPRPVPDVLEFLTPEARERREKITAARLSPGWPLETPALRQYGLIRRVLAESLISCKGFGLMRDWSVRMDLRARTWTPLRPVAARFVAALVVTFLLFGPVPLQLAARSDALPAHVAAGRYGPAARDDRLPGGLGHADRRVPSPLGAGRG